MKQIMEKQILKKQILKRQILARLQKQFHKKSVKIYFVIAIFTLLLNVLAWNSRAFCDGYLTYIFPIWVNTYGRFMGLFPFSVGEWMIVAGIALVVLAVALGAVWLVWRLFPFLFRGKRRMAAQEVVGQGLEGQRLMGQRFVCGFYVAFAWILLGVCLIMTLNCSILYHASTFEESYMGNGDAEGGVGENDVEENDVEDLLTVRNLVAAKCNAYSQLAERDENGKIRYTQSTLKDGTVADMQDKAIENMQKLGEKYPRLAGFYPRPKAMFFSDFMCQQYMQGYYFPFSLEANYNDVMYIMNKPSTMCHELAHLRGYIYEDEANFISFLACTGSDDPYFQYAGYLSVLIYLENDLYEESTVNPERFAQAVEECGLVEILPKVWEDNIFVEEEEWDRIDGKAVIATETVEEATDIFVDTSLKINGVSDGMVSYSRVVKLLLQYYLGED